MARPLVSVVMAVKDGEPFLREALQSIVDQRYRPIEIIVVDGESHDRSVAIASSFDLVRVIGQPGRGRPDAHNAGVAEARGELIAFLSSDDIWTDGKLETQVGYMLAHPELRYTVGRAQFFLEPGVARPAVFRPELLEGDHTALIPETLVARRETWTEVGAFDVRLTIAWDVDWFTRARHLDVPMAVLPDLLLRKRVHAGNTSHDTATNNRELLRVARAAIRRRHQPTA